MKLSRFEAFDIIGVSSECSDAEIKNAYKKLALQWHPDKNGGSAESTAKFKQISAAYSRLQAKDDETSDEEDYGMDDDEIIPFEKLMDFFILRMFMKDDSRSRREDFFRTSFTFQSTGFGSGTSFSRSMPFNFGGSSSMRRGPSPEHEALDSDDEDDTWMYRRRERMYGAERERMESEARRRVEEEAEARKKRDEEEVQRKATLKARHEAEEAEKRRKKQEKARNKQKQVFGGNESSRGNDDDLRKSAGPASDAPVPPSVQASTTDTASQNLQSPFVPSRSSVADTPHAIREPEKVSELRSAPQGQEAEKRQKKPARASRKEKAASAAPKAFDGGAQGVNNPFAALETEESTVRSKGRNGSRSARRGKNAEARNASEAQKPREAETKKPLKSQSTALGEGRGGQRTTQGEGTYGADFPVQGGSQENASNHGHGDTGAPIKAPATGATAVTAGSMSAIDVVEQKRKQELLDEELARRLQAEEDMETAPATGNLARDTDSQGGSAVGSLASGPCSANIECKTTTSLPSADSRSHLPKNRAHVGPPIQVTPLAPRKHAAVEASSSTLTRGVTGAVVNSAAPTLVRTASTSGEPSKGYSAATLLKKVEPSKAAALGIPQALVDSREWQLEMERLEAGRRLDEQRQQQVLEQRQRKEELERAEQERRRRAEAKLFAKTATKVNGTTCKKGKKKKAKDKDGPEAGRESFATEELPGSAQGDSASDGRVTRSRSMSRSSSEAAEAMLENSQTVEMNDAALATGLLAGHGLDFSAATNMGLGSTAVQGTDPSMPSVPAAASSVPPVPASLASGSGGLMRSAASRGHQLGSKTDEPRPKAVVWQSAGEQGKPAWLASKVDPKQWKDVVQEEIWEEWPEEEFQPYKAVADVQTSTDDQLQSQSGGETTSKEGVAEEGRVEGAGARAGGWMLAEDVERELYFKAEQEPPSNDRPAGPWDLASILRDIQNRAAEVARLPLSEVLAVAEEYSRTSPTSPLEATAVLSDSGAGQQPQQKPYKPRQGSFLPKYLPPLSGLEQPMGTISIAPLPLNNTQSSDQSQAASSPSVILVQSSTGLSSARAAERPVVKSQLSASGRPFVPAACRPPIYSPVASVGTPRVAAKTSSVTEQKAASHGDGEKAGGSPDSPKSEEGPVTSPLVHMALTMNLPSTSSSSQSAVKPVNQSEPSAPETGSQQPEAPVLPYLMVPHASRPGGVVDHGQARAEQLLGLAPGHGEAQGHTESSVPVQQALFDGHIPVYPHQLQEGALYSSHMPAGGYMPNTAMQGQYMMAAYPVYPGPYSGQLEVAYGVPFMHPMSPYYAVATGFVPDQNGLVVGQPCVPGVVQAEGLYRMEHCDDGRQQQLGQQWEQQAYGAAVEPWVSGIQVTHGEGYGAAPAYPYPQPSPQEQGFPLGQAVTQVLQFGEHIAQIPVLPEGTSSQDTGAAKEIELARGRDADEPEGRVPSPAPALEDGLSGKRNQALEESVSDEQDRDGQDSHWVSSTESWPAGGAVYYDEDGDYSEVSQQIDDHGEGDSSQGEGDGGRSCTGGEGEGATGLATSGLGSERQEEGSSGWGWEDREQATGQQEPAGANVSSEQEGGTWHQEQEVGEGRMQPEVSSSKDVQERNRPTQFPGSNGQRSRGGERHKGYRGQGHQRQNSRGAGGGSFDPQGPPPCSFFQRGMCRFGEKCRFSHVISDERPQTESHSSKSASGSSHSNHSSQTGQAGPVSHQSRNLEGSSNGQHKQERQQEKVSAAPGVHHFPAGHAQEENALFTSVPPSKPAVNGFPGGGHGKNSREGQGGRHGRGGQKASGYWRPRGSQSANAQPAIHVAG